MLWEGWRELRLRLAVLDAYAPSSRVTRVVSSGRWPPEGLRQQRIALLGSSMAFVTNGLDRQQPTLLFVHGNPTWSYLWRHVLNLLSNRYRCIAVDLIGMGASGKPSIAYDYNDHAHYLEAFVDTVGLREVTVVGHDWGAVLALDLGRRRPEVVAATVICETHWKPWPSFVEMGAGERDLFQPLRTPGERERLILRENIFIDKVLPSGILRRLDPEEMQHYRTPYPTEDSRMPILQWIQQIPIGGEPASVAATIEANSRFLSKAQIPMLLLAGEPGALITRTTVQAMKAACPALTVRTVGRATHFLPEDCPDGIAAEISRFTEVPPT